MPDLLIELFSEEIPARMQAAARDSLRRLVTDGLVEAGLTYAGAGAFSTPRRLVLAIEGLSAESRPSRDERKGPRLDAPQQAIEGFLRSTGLALGDLEIRDDKKARVYYAVATRPGRPAAQIVAEVLEGAIRNFPWPKSMRWGAGALRWVRPLHSILCLLHDEAGAQVVPLSVDGIEAGESTRGHRFMAPEAFAVTSFEDYAARLRRARVMLDSAEREAAITQGARNLAFAAGLDLVEDAGLLAEVAGLVEWPVPLLGRIPEAFLGLPAEVLQTSMREHQKFFSARDPKSGRIEGFVTVANIETPDDGATILKGNLKVLAARLSDARFFWENDLRVAKAGMADWAEGLKSVTFQSRLGSQADRIGRVAALAREIAPLVGADPDQAARAAGIAKLDLRSAMVGEFPELQGVMGRYYALAAGEAEAVADAARDHYSPLGPSDAVPSAPVSVAVALADKLDTLTGFWAIDEKPTGSKDPFALRRAALGVIRLVLGNGVRAGLSDLFAKGFGAHQGGQSAGADLLSFFHDRLKVFLRDQGVRHDVIDACLALPGSDDLALLVRRATALAEVLKTEDGANLIQGFKRANNILTQAEARDGVEYSFGADPKFAETEEERALFDALDQADARIAPAMASGDFAAAMAAMAALRGPVDAFFTAVQVNSDNEIVRRNRLNLLSRIRQTCSGVADLARIEG
ncbi:glycine--tRNA ligase subunit beta [Pseudogemmobacter sonorensis]|uniref:glycine--tRNA ligase subunit beta n=1 Tax=Pseudogemmobacter sonorensis TaxID=2989681 RepID=UPI003673FC6C